MGVTELVFELQNCRVARKAFIVIITTFLEIIKHLF